MRILLISDIHSNLEALEASLAAAPPHDAIVNLGDIVGYGASPNEVTAKARELGGTMGGQTVVRGNHDKVVTGLDDVESFNPIAGLAALWSVSHPGLSAPASSRIACGDAYELCCPERVSMAPET